MSGNEKVLLYIYDILYMRKLKIKPAEELKQTTKLIEMLNGH